MKQYEPLIRGAAEKWGIPFALLYAQVRQESTGNPNAVSHCGAEGLLQLMPMTQHEMGLDPKDPKDEFDPEKNLNAGAHYLKRQHSAVINFVTTLQGISNMCVDADYWMLALASYNGGLGYVIRAINLCKTDNLSVRWANVALMLADKRCVVRSKRPDHRQITDYVSKIWTAYQAALGAEKED